MNHRQAMLMTSRFLSCVILVTFAACGSHTGGGGAPSIGGAPGTPCDPTIFSQGCSGTSKVVCDAATKQWKALDVCPVGQACVGVADPAAPNSAKRIATCIVPGATTDAGTSDAGGPGSDTVQSGDSSSTGDAGGTVSTDASTTSDAGGTTSPGGPWLKCVAEKCASQWGGCAAEPACKIASLCVDGCGSDKKCRQLCFDNTSGGAQDKLISVIMCADQTGCETGPAGPKCGDGKCEAGENSSTCPQDCKTTGPKCGNGTCEEGESNATCPQDCKATGPSCGNGKCEPNETPQSCLADCKPVCGDGKCELGEAKNTCPQDCGPSTVCGNSVCEQGETATSCPKDCGPKAVCGNGKCESGETASNCAADCSSGATCVEQKCGAPLKTCESSSKCLGIAIFGVLNSCASTNNCTDNNCVTQNCNKEQSACTQNTACFSLVSCLTSCQTEACQKACFDQTAMAQYDAFVNCANTNCPNG